MSNIIEWLPGSVKMRLAERVIHANRKPPKKKYNQAGHKERDARIKADNLKAAGIIRKRIIEENKRKYKKLYDAFEQRGGGAWYEALTGLAFDEGRIYLDIDYFESVLELGCELETMAKQPCITRLKNKLDRERLFTKYYYARDIELVSRRALMMAYACPGWADMNKIKSVYIERDRITKQTGIPHHVDHIVPICGDKVCGLHNEFNVRVITEAENLKKSNKFNVY